LQATIRSGSAPCVANDQIGEFGSTGNGAARQVLPPSFERWIAPVLPDAPSPVATNSVFGSSALAVKARQYGRWKCRSMPRPCQVLPVSVLAKISCGVVVNTGVAPLTLTVTSWTYGAGPTSVIP